MDSIDKGLAAAVRIIKLLAGSPEYKLQESRVRVPDFRQVVHARRKLQRFHHSVPGCGRY